jgi:ribosomal protein L37E
MQKWEAKVDCLLCKEQAVNVLLPCGHLQYCRRCGDKMFKKRFRTCLICEEEGTNMVVLKQISAKCGYKRRVFIEKKLHRNQVLLE